VRVSVEGFCPICGTRGTSAFCPNDGGEMKPLGPKAARLSSPSPVPAATDSTPPPPVGVSARRGSTRSKKTVALAVTVVLVVSGLLSLGIQSLPPAHYSDPAQSGAVRH